MTNEAKTAYIAAHGKSQAYSFILTLLLGPLGLLYASPIQGIILIVLLVALAATPAIIAVGPIVWLLCIPLGASAVASRNKKAAATADLMSNR